MKRATSWLIWIGIMALVGTSLWLLRDSQPRVPEALLPSKNPEPIDRAPTPPPSPEESALTPATPPAPLPSAFNVLKENWFAQIDPALHKRIEMEAWLERPGLISGRLRFDGLRMEPASIKWSQDETGKWFLSDASLPSLPKSTAPEFPRYLPNDGVEEIEGRLADIKCSDVRVSFSEAYWEAENLKEWVPSLLYRVDAICPGSGPGAVRERWTLRAEDLSVARKRPATRTQGP
jgi:hypothetical protein